MLIKTINTVDYVDEITECLSKVIESIGDKDIFIYPSKLYIEKIINGYGEMFGAFIDDKLIGFASVIFPGNRVNNLGNWFNLDSKELEKVVQLEHIAVFPQYQSLGVGSELFAEIIKKYHNSYDYLISTVSPKNIKSLSLAFKYEQQIRIHKNLYGVERFIMFRCFKKKYVITKTIMVDVCNTADTIQLLCKGYYGLSFTEDKKSLILARGYYEKI